MSLNIFGNLVLSVTMVFALTSCSTRDENMYLDDDDIGGTLHHEEKDSWRISRDDNANPSTFSAVKNNGENAINICFKDNGLIDLLHIKKSSVEMWYYYDYSRKLVSVARDGKALQYTFDGDLLFQGKLDEYFLEDGFKWVPKEDCEVEIIEHKLETL